MKTVMKKLLSVMLVALLLVSAVPFAAFADEASTVTVTIYEVDKDNNAVQVAVVENVNVAAYENNDALVAAIYDGQYSNYRFRDFGDGTAMLQVWPIETPDEKEIFTLTLIHNNGTSDRNYIEVLEGDNILNVIAEYGIKNPSKEGYKFMGWSFNHTTENAEDARNIVTYLDVIKGDTTLYGDFQLISDDEEDADDVVYDAVLKIYTNGKTSSAAKSVDLDVYAVDGVITRSEVEACVKKYYKAANDNGMTFYGLFTTTNGVANYKTADTVKSVELEANKTTTIYVMVTNATAITTTTNKPVDSTNPQTGDAIGLALAVMMSTGGAALTLAKKKFF